MINYKKSDITNLDEGIIVHGVNCQGAMGSGVAKAIKEKWPMVYSEYMSLFIDNKPKPKLLGKSQAVHVSDNLYIFNAFTQIRYGKNDVFADATAIKSALQNVIITTDMMDLESIINMPMIGSGLGGLDWGKNVVPVLQELTTKHDVEFIIHYIDK